MAKSHIGLAKSEQIAQTLEREIRRGRVANGAQLASENELVRRFSVSRNTVRKGLEQLARQGLITTRSGIGSFVTYDGASIDNALGWTLALSDTADHIETRILRVERGSCADTSDFLKHSINCHDCSDDFLCVDRIRLISNSDVAISLERSRSPWHESFQQVLKHGLLNNSLSNTLAAANLVIDHGEEWAHVLTHLSAHDAKAMARTPQQAMLQLRRVTRSVNGQLIEFVESILDPAKFGLHLKF